ncbi:hypothetical protein C8R43DRAFT_97016 [Mycena crocata]|nr:hypothetical protein C8R43DRAFT_97016 [Mycena crocata]
MLPSAPRLVHRDLPAFWENLPTTDEYLDALFEWDRQDRKMLEEKTQTRLLRSGDNDEDLAQAGSKRKWPGCTSGPVAYARGGDTCRSACCMADLTVTNPHRFPNAEVVADGATVKAVNSNEGDECTRRSFSDDALPVNDSAFPPGSVIITPLPLSSRPTPSGSSTQPQDTHVCRVMIRRRSAPRPLHCSNCHSISSSQGWRFSKLIPAWRLCYACKTYESRNHRHRPLALSLALDRRRGLQRPTHC